MKFTSILLGLCTVFILSSGFCFELNSKYDSNEWIKNIVENLNVNDYYLSLTSDGNLVVTGTFSNKVRFGSQALVSVGSNDIFVAKYANNGNLIWLRQGGGSDFDMANIIRTDTLGNIYITGYVTGISFFGDYILRSRGQRNVFTVKYDKSGEIVWLKAEGADLYFEKDPKKRKKLLANIM
jgi:hypothetical protein